MSQADLCLKGCVVGRITLYVIRMNVVACRLHPSQDLRRGLTQFVHDHCIQAGFILSGIGSLSQAAIRFANQPQPTLLDGPFEVIALSGTVSVHGLHVHGAIANRQGCVLGGHLCDGSIIYTTAEVVIGIADHLIFKRELDPQTGFLELTIDYPIGSVDE